MATARRKIAADASRRLRSSRDMAEARDPCDRHLVTVFRVLRVRNRAKAVTAGQQHLRASGRWSG
jgi:hypothetical protein